MIKEMIVSSTALETKIAILEDDQLAELYIERNRNRGILGNIYKGRVTKVLPGMQSAFVNVGLEKDSFLYVSDFIEDTEEYDKVLTEAEEQVATALAEIEVQERPQAPPRKDQRPDRRKWRDRKERLESSRAVPARAGSSPAGSGQHREMDPYCRNRENDPSGGIGPRSRSSGSAPALRSCA